MPQIIYVKSTILIIDGVDYSYSIYRNHERYMGLWNCKRCDRHEMVPLIQPNAEMAAALSSEQIKTHHKQVHPTVFEKSQN